MTCGEFCNRQVVIARRDERVAEAARRLRDFHVGTLIVVAEQDGRRIPVGILTDRDLVVRASRSEELSGLSTLVSREQKREHEATPVR